MKHSKNCEACAKHEACPTWDRATYFDVDEGAEELHYDNADEAIAYHLEDLDDEQLAELLDEGTIEVHAFVRKPPPEDAWFKQTASWMADNASEQWDERFGNPDGDPALSDDERAPLEVAIVLLLRGTLAGKTVWQCEETCSRVYDGDRLYAFVKAEQLERAGATSSPAAQGGAS